MARQDTKGGKQRAISQDNTVRVQKLNKELRRLKQGTETRNKSVTKRSNGNLPKT
jgi:hypothetical protein